jgi:GT2 family glycosyltransferase
MGHSVRIAAVIPVHNRKDLTLQCLRSMGRLVLEGISMKIFVVDDGSTDGTSDAVIAEFPDVEIVKGDGNLWYTGAINLGMEKALETDPDFLLLMNDDQVFDQNAVLQLVSTAKNYPNSIVGGLLLLWNTPHRIFQVSPIWKLRWGGWRHWQKQTIWTIPSGPWEVDLIVGNCMLVPSEAVRMHGPMDIVRFPNFGDAEFTPRLKKKGYRLILEPRSRVFCQPNNLPASVGKMTWVERYRTVWGDMRMTQNIRRRWNAWVFGGPNPFSGAMAFFIFFLRHLLRRNLESSYGRTVAEPALRDLLRDRELVKVNSDATSKMD